MSSHPAVRAFTIAGPVRDTRRPRALLPQGSCDCHAHVFGPQERYPYVAHASYIPPDATPADYARMLTTIGCSRAVLVQPSVYGTDHRAMLDAMRSGIFAFRGVATPDGTTTDRELDDMHAAGVRGIRFNLASQTPGLGLDAVPRWADRLKGRGWHLQFFAHLDRMPELETQLAGLDIPIVFDHFGLLHAEAGLGQPGFQSLLRFLRRDNCWAKLIGPYRVSKARGYADVAPYARAMVEVAPTRLVWGTDWPHPNVAQMPDDGDLADLVPDWISDAAQRKAILVDNPARLYDF